MKRTQVFRKNLQNNAEIIANLFSVVFAEQLGKLFRRKE